MSVVEASSEDVLPAQCYVCQSRFSANVHTVLQLCDCKVAICQQCAINRMVLTEDFTLDCLICGYKVDSSANTGIIRNVSRVKELVDKYLERSFRFFKLPIPPKADPTVSQYYPLLVKFTRIPELAPFLSEFLQAPPSDSDSNQTVQRRKLNASYMKLQLARAEQMRGGELPELATEPAGNISIVEKAGELSLGPLRYLQLTRNIYLERLLSLGGSDCCGNERREIDTTCITCHSNILPGESIQFSCSCEMLLCRGCAVRSFAASKNTYRKGIACPLCTRNSMISFGNVEKAKEEEQSIVYMLTRQFSTGGVTYSSKSVIDLRKLLEHLYNSGAAPMRKTKDEIHGMSFHQVELELSRIYVIMERKKTRHDRLIKKEKKPVVKKTKEEGKEAEFSIADMKGKKGGGVNKKKKDADAGDIEVDQVVTYDNSADEQYLFQASERDRGYDLPVGPLRLLRFRVNPFIEMYLAYTSSEDAPTDGKGALLYMQRFNQFKPRFNTVCPKCTINPQNMGCVRAHLKTCHDVTRKDEIEKFLKQVNVQPVAVETYPYPYPQSKTMSADANPPAAPFGRDLLSSLSVNLSALGHAIQF